MTEKPIAYETHPVSPERKAELVAAGFKIVDAVYAPKGEVSGTQPAVEPANAKLSDEQLHEAIKDATGKAPHPKTGRDKLLAQYNALKAAE